MSIRSKTSAGGFSATDSAEIADRLREDILSGFLLPGAALRQDALASRLETSRTPVRQALHLLAGEGLVSYVPQKGARVARISSELVRDLFDMRIALEPIALAEALANHDKIVWAEAEMALDRADAAEGNGRSLARENAVFHTTLLRPCGRDALLETISRLSDRGVRAEIAALSVQSRVSDSAEEHRMLLAACRDRNPSAAGDLLIDHLKAARDQTLSVLDMTTD